MTTKKLKNVNTNIIVIMIMIIAMITIVIKDDQSYDNGDHNYDNDSPHLWGALDREFLQKEKCILLCRPTSHPPPDDDHRGDDGEEGRGEKKQSTVLTLRDFVNKHVVSDRICDSGGH